MKGFALSLSGGVDSSSIAILTYEMFKRILEKQGIETLNKKFNLNLISSDNIHFNVQKIINKILFTAYQKTENSSKETQKSAKVLSEFIGSNHYEWSIDSEVKSITEKISDKTAKKYSWEKHDITLQNVQARVRSPYIWFIANANNLLLLSTSNRSESSVGYSTMDGDSSGSISPIAGLDKVFLKNLLKYLKEEYNYACLDNVLSLKPSAELKPIGQNQYDEDDLMPYNVLTEIERNFIKERKGPKEIFNILKRKEFASDEILKKYIKTFFQLFARNQWKRERTAPSFHFDDYSLDASSWLRFPILSNNFEEEIDNL